MKTSRQQIAGLHPTPPRSDRANHHPLDGDDSPYSPVLGLWLAAEAARHRCLLRNIRAAEELRRREALTRS